MDTITEQQRFCDREFTAQEVSIIQEVIATCNGLSRFELAHTVCELLDWKRPNGRLKARECRDLLERLEDQGVVRLPEKKSAGSKASRKHKDAEIAKHSFSTLTGSVEAFLPLRVELVQRPEQRELFLELMGRYHYLGYAMPYGARLQYLISVEQPRREVVGCVQFSSPAWRIKDRDQWIGWDDETRKSRLQHIVNNSRLLILAQIDNLASKMLSDVMRRLRGDWGNEYKVEPWLVETMVDRQRFQGGCYRAANFLEIGQTTGRGRNDQTKDRRESEIKTVLVYPLIKYARQKLSASR
jgi:hypothetical protein